MNNHVSVALNYCANIKSFLKQLSYRAVVPRLLAHIFTMRVCSIDVLAFIYSFVFQFRTVRILLSRGKGDDGATMCN